MNKSVVLLLLYTGHLLNGQAQTVPTIDNTNYYKFSNVHADLNWLRTCDAVPIIIDELLKNNIPYHTISVGDLVKVNDSTRFVVTVSFEKSDKKYGFLYEPIHGVPLNSKDRDFMKNH